MRTRIRLSFTTTGALVAASVLFGAGAASADGYDGQTWGDASADVSSWGGTPVVASITGSQLALEDCIVIDSKQSHERDGLGQEVWGEYMFYLNCNASVAGGRPGNSVQSAAGRQAKKDQEAAQWLNTKLQEDPEYCNDKTWCAYICESTGMCTLP